MDTVGLFKLPDTRAISKHQLCQGQAYDEAANMNMTRTSCVGTRV